MSDVQRAIEKMEEANAYIAETGAGARQQDASAAALEAIQILRNGTGVKPRSEVHQAHVITTDPFGTWRCPVCSSAILRIRSIGGFFEVSCVNDHPLIGAAGGFRTVGIDEQQEGS